MDELEEKKRVSEKRGINRGYESQQPPPQNLRRRDSNRAHAGAVEVHIEELVLHGFASGDRYRIGDAIQEELARLLEAQGLPPTLQNGVALDQIDGGTLRVNAGASAATIGGEMARALHRGLSGLNSDR